jgi:hypothetical protein
MGIDKTIVKISLLSFLIGCGGLGLALNCYTAVEAIKNKHENPTECCDYVKKLREDHQKNMPFIPYYTFVKDSIFNGYEKPSVCK